VHTQANFTPQLQVFRVPITSQLEVMAKVLEYERNHTDTRRRIGVLFVPEGCVDENQCFKSTGSPHLYVLCCFEGEIVFTSMFVSVSYEFMDMLAERVKLLGWPKYSGGLNTKDNSTGVESYYTGK
jgi:hypothetical protein